LLAEIKKQPFDPVAVNLHQGQLVHDFMDSNYCVGVTNFIASRVHLICDRQLNQQIKFCAPYLPLMARF